MMQKQPFDPIVMIKAIEEDDTLYTTTEVVSIVYGFLASYYQHPWWYRFIYAPYVIALNAVLEVFIKNATLRKLKKQKQLDTQPLSGIADVLAKKAKKHQSRNEYQGH